MSAEIYAAVYGDYPEWKGWDARVASIESRRAYMDVRRAGINTPLRVLEIGFGDGAFLRRMKAADCLCAGVELEERHIASLRREGIDARVGTIEQFEDASFDLIVAFDVFEHMPLAVLKETLDAAYRKLTRSGRLLARFPNMLSPFGVINYYGDITHTTPLSATSLAQLARLSRFELISAANASTVGSAGGPLRAIVKPFTFLVRRLVELILSFGYYGRFVPLDTEVVVVLGKS